MGSAVNPPQADQRQSWGFPLYLALVALWVWLLHGFVSLPLLTTLALVGPLALLLGAYLTAAAVRHCSDSPWYMGAFLFGVLLLAGGLLTLAPQAPGAWLNASGTGWQLLAKRTEHVSDALRAGDGPRLQRLLSRGLGDDEALMPNGRPLLHSAEGELLQLLLDAGLSADVRDEEERSLLALTWEMDTARRLLAAGADIEARDRLGSTPLMAARDKDEAFIQLLLEAGADVHATDYAGRRVVDLFDAAGPRRQLLEAFAGQPLPPPEELHALDLGRRDWLVADSGAAAGLSLDRAEPRAGELVQVQIRLVGDSAQDRLLDVRMELGPEALLVAASNGGEIASPQRIPAIQTLHWPLLALPSGEAGALTVTVLLRDVTGGNGRSPGSLSLHLVAHDRLSQVDEQFSLEQALGQATAAYSGLNPWHLMWLPFVLLTVLTLPRLLRRQLQRRTLLRPVAALIALVCFGLAILQAWQLAQPFVAFDPAQCTVLDRRAQPYTIEAQRRTGLEQRLRTPRGRARLEYAPIAAVRIETGAETVYASGFASGTALHPLSALREFPLGASLPCWVDPAQPTRFTLLRTPSVRGSIGLALLLFVSLALVRTCSGRPVASRQ